MKNKKRKLYLHYYHIILATLLTLIQIVGFMLYTSSSDYDFWGKMIFLAVIFYSSAVILTVVKIIRNSKLNKDVSYLTHQKELSQKHALTMDYAKKRSENQLMEITSQLNELYQYLDHNDIKTAQEYTQKISSVFQNTHYRHYCSNSIVDAILHQKELEAQNQNVKINYSILLPQDIQIPIPSLVCLLFNLLDNGIDACVSSGCPAPFLLLETDYKGSFMSIHMKNSKTPSRQFDHTTTKADPTMHGFGLTIIENIVSDRDGTWEWIDSGDIFESLVMLKF